MKYASEDDKEMEVEDFYFIEVTGATRFYIIGNGWSSVTRIAVRHMSLD
jgi:hypothetical protein